MASVFADFCSNSSVSAIMSELTWLYLLNSCTFLTVGYAIAKQKQKRDPLSVSPRGEG